MNLLSEIMHFVKGLAPAADRWNTNPASDVVCLKDFQKAVFVVHQQGGTTGKATLQIEACTNAAADGNTAIPFKYRVGADGAGANGDVFGAITDALAAGFDTTPNSDRLYLLEVDAAALPATKPYVRLQSTESANDPVNASVEVLLVGPRYCGASMLTAIS